MFTKVEQKSSIVLKSNKSTKPALDKDKIDTLFGKSKEYNNYYWFDNAISFYRVHSTQIW